MTPNQQREIELRINAKNLTGKAVGDVVKDLKEVKKALAEQSKAAADGQADFKKLETAMRQLSNAQDALTAQSKLIDDFRKQSATLDKLQTGLIAAEKAYVDFAQSASQSGVITAKQHAQLLKLESAVAAFTPKIDKVKSSMHGLSYEASRLGMDFNQVSIEQTKLDNRTRVLLKSIINLRSEQERLKQVDLSAKLRNEAAAAQAAAQALRDESTQLVNNAQAQAKLQAASVRNAAAQRTLTSSLNEAMGAAHPLKSALDNVDATLVKSQSIVKNTAKANRDAQKSYSELAAAQRKLIEVAGVIDMYRKQQEAVSKSRVEYQKLQIELRNQNAAIQASIAPTAQQVQALQRLSSQLVQSRINLQQQIETARRTQSVLREAGVATSNLAAAEQRLVTTARSTTSEMQRLAHAYNANDTAARRAASGSSAFANSSREALSFSQRLRGQLLSLAAAYVGLYGAANFAYSAITAFKNQEALKIQLEVVADGDLNLAGEMEKYLRGQVDRMGLDLKSTAKSYSSFAIAAKEAGHNQEEVNYMFERFSELGTTMGKTPDELSGMFKAFEQMMSKGSIQAEELRQQLGDRLPGAISLMAQSMGVTTKELGDMMMKGEVGSENLIRLAELADKKYGDAANKAAASLIAEENRMKTGFENWLRVISEAGLADSYKELMVTLTQFFNSEDGLEFARGIGEAFSTVVDVLKWCVENSETLVEVFKILIALQLASWLMKGVVAFQAVAGSVIAASGSMTTLLGTMTLVQKAFAVLAAAVLGFKIGTWLYAEFKQVRIGASWMVQGLLSGFTVLTKTATSLLNQLPRVASLVGNSIFHALMTPLRAAIENVSQAARFLGADSVATGAQNAADLLNRSSQIKSDLSAIKTASVNTIVDIGNTLGEIDREMTALRYYEASGLSDQEDKRLREQGAVKIDDKYKAKTSIDTDAAMADAAKRKKSSESDEKKKAAKKTEAEKAAEKAAKEAAKAEEDRQKAITRGLEERAKLEADVYKKLSDMENNHNKKSLDSLSDRHKAVAAEYAELYANIEKLRNGSTVEYGETKSIDLGGRGGLTGGKSGLRFQGGVRTDGVHEATYMLAKLMNQISGDKYAVSSMKRNSKNSLHSAGLAVDMAMPYGAQSNAFLREFKATMESLGFKQGKHYFAQMERKGQVNKNGSVSSGDHFHVEIKGNDVAAAIAQALSQKSHTTVPNTKGASVSVPGVSADKVDEMVARTRELEKQAMLRAQEEFVADNIKAIQERLNAIETERNGKLELAQSLREQGLINEEMLQTRVNEIMTEFAPKVAQARTDAMAIAESLSKLDPSAMDKVQLSLAKFQETMAYTPGEMSIIKNITGELDSMFQGMFTSAAEGFASIITGTKSASEGFRDILKSFVNFVGQFLIKMGQMIIQAILFKSIMSALGLDAYMQAGSAIGQGLGMVGKRHSGGIVGTSQSAVMTRLPMGVFAAAPRYHSGGIVGLAANEVPIVAERGEEVITADDPRHISNISGQPVAKGTAGTPVNLNVTNVINPKDILSQGLSDNGGQNIIIDVIAKNKSRIKGLLG